MKGRIGTIRRSPCRVAYRPVMSGVQRTQRFGDDGSMTTEVPVRPRWVLLAIGVLLTACTGTHPVWPWAAPEAGEHPIRLVRTVTTGLTVPWGVALLPGGDALVTERDTARILRVRPDGIATELGRIPGATSGGPDREGGLLGLAVSPHFARDHEAFVYYTAADGNRVARLSLEGDRIGPLRPVITGIPRAPFHNGGRITFGPDNMLYVATGDGKRAELAQNLASLGGKILRVTPDGTPAPGNPFPHSPVYSYGHRNVEGLAFDSTGRLWAAEFGEDTWDELNLIRPGGDYGWPIVEGAAHRAGLVDPVVQWRPEEASPAGMAIVKDVAYVAALRGERLWRIPLQGERVGTPEPLLVGQYGRLRTVLALPNGALWVTTSNRDGRGDVRPGDDQVLEFAVT